MYAVKWDDFRYSRLQFGIWRIAFGVYLAIYFLKTLPWGNELYSNQGPFIRIDYPDFPTFFPSFLLHYDSPQTVKGMLIACAVLSTLLMLGFFRRWAALFLWLLTMWFANRNPMTDSPEYGFVNWLIFACIFIPEGEALSLSRPDIEWKMPRFFYWGAWIVLGIGYFYAGSSKFKSHDPSWMNGAAMYYVLATDNARLGWYGTFFNLIPKGYFMALTWGALFLQTLSPIFIYFRKVRPIWWVMSTCVHIGLLFFVNLGQLTLGMIFFHLFLIDQNWIRAVRSKLKAT